MDIQTNKTDENVNFQTNNITNQAGTSPISIPPIIQQSSPINLNPPPKNKKLFGIISVMLFLVVGLTVTWAYREGYLNGALLDESNFASELALSVSQIDTATYTIGTQVVVEPRDPNKKPIVLDVTDEDLSVKYDRDYERLQIVDNMISDLEWGYFDDRPVDAYKDPFNEVVYVNTGTAEDYKIKVQFETKELVEQLLEEYPEFLIDTRTPNTVVFVPLQEPNAFFYLSYQPPNNFMKGLADFSKSITPELNVQGSILFKTFYNTTLQSYDWSVIFDTVGIFEDLTYKINIESIKKDTSLYFKINNMPPLLFFEFPKDQWYVFDAKENSDELLDFGVSVEETEQTYKKSRENFVNLLKQAIALSDTHKVFNFTNRPSRESLGDESVYKYTIGFKKETLHTLIKELILYVENNPTLQEDDFLVKITMEDLNKKSVQDLLEYFENNLNMTVYLDKNKTPLLSEIKLVIVPPDSNTQLKDKQVLVTFNVALSDINNPTMIEKPEPTKPMSEFIESVFNFSSLEI